MRYLKQYFEINKIFDKVQVSGKWVQTRKIND